jgi:predicted nucleotidyltransferase
MSVSLTIVDQQSDTIRNLCRAHHVARLTLVGSAASGAFDASRSDLDFLVKFLPLSPADRADAYFNLLAALQDLFSRDIDLVEEEAVSNPYLIQTIEADHRVVYAA